MVGKAIENVKENIKKLKGSLGKKVVIDLTAVRQKEVDAYAQSHLFSPTLNGAINQKAWLGHLHTIDF